MDVELWRWRRRVIWVVRVHWADYMAVVITVEGLPDAPKMSVLGLV